MSLVNFHEILEIRRSWTEKSWLNFGTLGLGLELRLGSPIPD